MSITSTYKPGRKSMAAIAVLAFTTVCIVVAHLCLPYKGAKAIPADTKVILPFHTISMPGSSQDLYAYELHRRQIPQDDMPEYCAVVRNIDPARDDYKAYCRAVVADIMKTTGSKKIIVYVYDSNEAYHLYEVRFLLQLQNLDAREMATVNDHHIATYIGERANGDYEVSRQLSFYEDAHNGYTGQEPYGYLE